MRLKILNFNDNHALKRWVDMYMRVHMFTASRMLGLREVEEDEEQLNVPHDGHDDGTQQPRHHQHELSVHA